jgi:beta-glucanase (GH16 family)
MSFRSVITAILISILSAGWAYSAIVWQDEFDGTSIDNSIWTYDVGDGGFGNGELQYHTARPENAYIENGSLVIEARRESYKGSSRSFTSARLKTLGRFAFKYGTLEARIKVPNLANGLWPAFWLMGQNIGQKGWPACGEIDILEMGMKSAIDAGLTNRRVHAGAFWDYNGSNANYGADKDATVNLNNDYHLYKIAWTPTSMNVYLDGVQFWALDISNPTGASLEEFHQPMFIITNLSVGGSNFVEITNPAQITAPFPAKMYIDYIRLDSNAYTEVYYGADSAETGNFGILTETTPVNNEIAYGTDAELFIWENTLTPVTATPYDGSSVWSFQVPAGHWFGMGVFCLENKNMSNYSDGFLKMHMKTNSTATFKVGIAGSSAGESWVTFANGGWQYGLVRDGAWHEVSIPLNSFGNVDFATIKQIFMLVGDAPSSVFDISIDNVYWAPSVERPVYSNGSFGIFTETASHKNAGEFALGAAGDFYIWDNTLTTRAQTPYEGSGSMSLQSVAGKTWFGLAFTPNIKHDLTAFRYPESKLHFALKTTSTTMFMVGMKSGNVEDIGQKWITFQSGSDPYGFVRDGQWHVVEIPMADIANAVDLSQVSQLFEILGINGAISNIEFDDVCFTGGGASLGNNSPTVSIDSPTNNQFFDANDDITITATAADTDGTISKVEFFNGTTLLGEDTTSPYSFTWNDVPGGSYDIGVKATDDKGGSRSASVHIYVGAPVLASMTVSPASDSVEVGLAGQFTATGVDQFGLPIAADPQWSVSGGGSIDATGLFTAVFPGLFTVTAQDGSVTATAAVDVTKPFGNCNGGPANGEYTYQVSSDSTNPTITFIPGYAGVGSDILILYYKTNPAGAYSALFTSPNTPRQVTASAGQTVYFYYYYSVPGSADHDTHDNPHTVVVGSCTGSAAGDINGDGSVGLDDISMLAFYWLGSCTSDDDYCYGADTQPDGIVNLLDMAYIARYWLN